MLDWPNNESFSVARILLTFVFRPVTGRAFHNAISRRPGNSRYHCFHTRVTGRGGYFLQQGREGRDLLAVIGNLYTLS